MYHKENHDIRSSSISNGDYVERISRKSNSSLVGMDIFDSKTENQKFNRFTYLMDEDKELLDSYFNIGKALDLPGGLIADKIVEGSIEQVGYLISEAFSINAGANFIRYGKKAFGIIGKSIFVIEITYDSLLNPKYYPVINKGYKEELGLIESYSNQAVAISKNISKLYIAKKSGRYNDRINHLLFQAMIKLNRQRDAIYCHINNIMNSIK